MMFPPPISPQHAPASPPMLVFNPPASIDLAPIWHGLSGHAIDLSVVSAQPSDLQSFIDYCRTEGTSLAHDMADFCARLKSLTRNLIVGPQVPAELFRGALALYRAGVFGEDARLDPQVQREGENWAHYLARYGGVFDNEISLLPRGAWLTFADRFLALEDAGMALGAWSEGVPSPVVMAIRAKNLVTLEAMLASEPRLHLSPGGVHPMHLAASGEVAQLRAMLLVVEEIEVPDSEGHTALHFAAACGQFESVAALLKSNAKIEAADAAGVRPVHLAARRADGGAVIGLLLERGARPNPHDDDGFTPLIYAAAAGNAEAADRLVARLAQTPLDGRPQLVEELEMASLMASKQGFDSLAQKLARQSRQWALECAPHPPDPAEREPREVLGLCGAYLADDLAALKELLDAGVNPNQPIVKGRPLLLIAADAGRHHMVKALLESGADPKLGIPSPLSIWSVAAMQGRREVVETLLEGRLRPSEAEREQAVDIARQLGSDDIAEILLKPPSQ